MVAEERVAKLMAARGLCSRREAEVLIGAGHVTVDGVLVERQGAKAGVSARIEISAAGRATLGESVTVVLHKPVGIVSAQPARGQTPAWKLLSRDRLYGEPEEGTVDRVVAAPDTLSVVGRLDRASRGLLLLTQDGAVARRVIGGNAVSKSYVVNVAQDVSNSQVVKLNQPMRLDGRPLLPMRVARLDARTLRFELVEGKKHQIRRCCRHLGLHVVDLLRDRIGSIELGDLPEGRWRPVAALELEKLRC
jgi:23S rRNA pseudouridine2604 synthase